MDYSLTSDYNQWCLSEETVTKNKVTSQTITVPTDPPAGDPWFFVGSNTEPVETSLSKFQRKIIWSRPQDARLQDSRPLLKPHSLPRKQHKHGRNYFHHGLSGRKLHLPQATLGVREGTGRPAEPAELSPNFGENNRWLERNHEEKISCLLKKTLEIRDSQLKTLIKKSNDLIEANQKLAKELKKLRFIKNH